MNVSLALFAAALGWPPEAACLAAEPAELRGSGGP